MPLRGMYHAYEAGWSDGAQSQLACTLDRFNVSKCSCSLHRQTSMHTLTVPLGRNHARLDCKHLRPQAHSIACGQQLPY